MCLLKWFCFESFSASSIYAVIIRAPYEHLPAQIPHPSHFAHHTHSSGMIHGRLYCINIDNAVYQGFMDGVRCTPVTDTMSFGGKRCEFDWGRPLTDAEMKVLAKKKEEAGDRFVKDFTFHTRHIRETVSRTLISLLGDEGKKAVENAVNEYIEIFGKEFLC